MKNDKDEERERALARIKDPKVRAHYRAQWDMQDELAEEDVRTGGIFDVPGVPDSAWVTPPEVVETDDVEPAPPEVHHVHAPADGHRHFSVVQVVLFVIAVLVTSIVIAKCGAIQ